MRTVRAIVSTSDATRRVETDPADRRCRECDATSGLADARARLRAQRRPAESLRTDVRTSDDRPHGERVSASARELGPDQQSPTALPRYLR